MNKIFLCILLASFSLTAKAAETTFADIQKRVTHRDNITNAILRIDNERRFELTIKDNIAKIRIYTHLKTKDPNEEQYAFKVTEDILQENTRLQLQYELNKFIEKCDFSERKYRISKYMNNKLSLGMPYEEVKKVLGEDFKKGEPRAMFGSMSLESNDYTIEFRAFRLYDIIKKNKSL